MTGDRLVKTLPLGFAIETDGGESLLRGACNEARSAYNQTIRDTKYGIDWGTIHDRVEADLVKNSRQLIVEKAFDAVENFHEYDDYGYPDHLTKGPYPLRMNFTEGYNLLLDDETGEVRFRISAKPYHHVKGTVTGDPAHLDILRTALQSDEWKITTAEAMFRDGRPELHVNATNTEHSPPEPDDPETMIGMDVNEDNIALTAMDDSGVLDTLVIDFPIVKRLRHEYFVMRKRLQNAGKASFDTLFENRERRFVHDTVHKLSRAVVRFASQFSSPAIAVEDLNGMRDSIDYGTRMNRRLHSIPFHALRTFVSYKAAFDGIPTVPINPEYTSQMCALTDCEYVERANRRKHRFRCKKCGHQDHADRGASVNIAKKGRKRCNQHVPALKSLPQVRKVRRQASGSVNLPTSTRDRGYPADDDPRVSSRTEGSRAA